jgi:hypothetical protein
LEEHREKELPKVVTVMQKRWKGYKARQLLKRMKASIMIQKIWRGWKARTEYVKNKQKLKEEAEKERHRRRLAAAGTVALRLYRKMKVSVVKWQFCGYDIKTRSCVSSNIS